MTKNFEIMEVGLRDGLQIIKKDISIDYKLSIIKSLIESGVRNIQVTSFVNPKRVPSMADAEVEVRAVGFNGVESEGEKGIIRTFLEPDVSLIDIGVIDTNWIVYGEYAYVYYYLSMSRQEYQKYIDDGNYIWMTVEMCCDENQRVYYPSIVFKPMPDYATC